MQKNLYLSPHKQNFVKISINISSYINKILIYALKNFLIFDYEGVLTLGFRDRQFRARGSFRILKM